MQAADDENGLPKSEWQPIHNPIANLVYGRA